MKKIIWAACAAAVLAGCARVSDVTKISGKIDAEGINEVNVIVPELQIDTLVPVSDGKNFTVIAENNGPENIYIQSVTLNGQPYTKAYITYRDIMNGGELKFVMGPQPNESFGAAPEDRPRSVMQ